MEVCNHLFLRGERVGFLAYLWYNNISVLRNKALLEEPMTHRTQKLLALVLALALCFTGCSGTDYGSATLGTAPTQLPEPPANPYRPGAIPAWMYRNIRRTLTGPRWRRQVLILP